MGTQDMKKVKFGKDILEDPNFQINQEGPVYLAVRPGREELEPVEMDENDKLREEAMKANAEMDQKTKDRLVEKSMEIVDDKIKMMSPEKITLPIIPELKPHPPMDSEVRQTIHELNCKHAEVMGTCGNLQSRINELEEAEVLAQNQQAKMEEIISSLETKLDNQTIASTDAINGLMEKLDDLEKLSKWQHAVIVALLVDLYRDKKLFSAICAEAVEGVKRRTVDKSVKEILNRINQRQNTEPRKTGG